MTHFTFIRVIGQTHNRGVTVKSKLSGLKLNSLLQRPEFAFEVIMIAFFE